MKTKFLLSVLFLSVLFSRCKKDNPTPKAVRIDKIVLTDYSEKIPDIGSGWDADGNGLPDLYCVIINADNQVIYTSETLQDAVYTTLPMSFTKSIPFEIKDYQSTFNIKFYDFDDGSMSNDNLIGRTEISFSDWDDYPKSIHVNASNDLSFTLDLVSIY